MDITVGDIIAALENWAPPPLAEDWDNVGLQLGSAKKKVKKLAVCLDLNLQTLSQALAFDCLVTHHPLFFKPIKKLSTDAWPGYAVAELLRHDVALVCAHTNLDAARDGVTEVLAQKLKLETEGALVPSPGSELFLVSVYVPKGYEERIRQFLLATEAAVRGQYKACTFTTEGLGSFYPLARANPTQGERERLNLVSESKIEFLAPAFVLPKLLKGLEELHPYEEVPIDFWPVKGKDPRFGLGRIGELPLEYTLLDLAQKMGEILNTKGVYLVGEPHRLVRRVALCAGAGGELWRQALEKGADVYLTAEIKYHQAREAEAAGLALITFGHFESEYLIVPELARYFSAWAKERGCYLEVSVLEEKAPFQGAFA